MYVLVIGCSEVGYQLAKSLLASRHEVVVVEKDRNRFNFLSQELGSVALHGDGTDDGALKRAGAARADILVAATKEDEVNLVACQIAKHVFQTPKTMAIVREPRNEPIFQVLGVDTVVNSTNLVLERLEERIPDHTLLHLMNLGSPAMELVSITVPSDAAVVGKRLGEVEMPMNCFVSAVVRRTNVERPLSGLVLEAEDELLIVSAKDYEQNLYDILTGI